MANNQVAFLILIIAGIASSGSEAADKDGFPVAIIHINDLHAR